MTGTPSILGTAAVEEGARLLLEAGIGPMRAKSTQLTSYLIELADAWLAPLGCALATPREASRRGGHVTICHPRAERLVSQLAEANIITDYRTPDRCRFGLPPLTTRFTDVWTAVDAARDIIERKRGRRTMAEPVTYSGYLRLDQLLSAQQPRSSEHDEMLFIVIHQIYELWFKQLLHELGKLQSELESGATTHAMRTLRRTLAILKIMVAQLDVLETMTPTQFTRFRDWLGTSSGFESAQFRELEAVLGRRERMMVARYAAGSAERERIAAAMSRPALFDSFAGYLAAQGYDVPAEIRRRDVRRAPGGLGRHAAGTEEGLRRRH